jgi:uncharacterized protein YjeT (DUF2065 family)
VSRARQSLLYPITYLTTTGVGLLVAPTQVVRLMFATGAYDAASLRMAGGLMLALGVLVVQVYRHGLDALYPTLVGVRVLLCAIWLGLYASTRDPFFLAVFCVVAFGFVWTALALRRDRAAPSS